VQGNRLGTNEAGMVALPNGESGVTLAAPGNFVGGTTPQARNLISGNAYFGVALTGAAATGNTIQSNYIGTNAEGTGRLGNGYDGVMIYEAPNNLIGGPFRTAGNLISANGRAGVMILGAGAQLNRVQGNRIGTTWQGGSGLLGNEYGGVYIYGAAHNLIGDPSGGELGNEIAFNLHNGVTVVDGVGNGIRGNSIFDNAKLGIDIHDDGVTWWNLTWLYGGWTYPGFTFTQGFVYGEPGTRFEVELFANSDSDPSGYGEGELLIGRETVFTDNDGLGYFQSVLYVEVPPGYCLTATATIIRNNLPFGETWEFGNCALVEAFSSPGRGAGGDLPAALRRADVVRPLTTATLPRQERLDATTVLDHAFSLAVVHPSADTVFSTVPNHESAWSGLDLAMLDALALEWLGDVPVHEGGRYSFGVVAY
jgi:hypothetical protein